MHRSCRWCKTVFDIADEDMVFYEKVSPVFAGKKYLVPPPTVCPPCRSARRMCMANERQLYHDVDAITQAPILSIYRPGHAFPVVSADYWWSDRWDARDYGRDFDFSRPFFEQYRELSLSVPRMNQNRVMSENCNYCTKIAHSKNCYMTVGFEAQNCLYGHYSRYVQSCVDFYFLIDSQYCYECVQCKGGYNLFYSSYSENCSDSYFLYDCRQCRNCFGCVGLRNKEYHIFNQPVSSEKFEQFILENINGSYQKIRYWREKFEIERARMPRVASRQTLCDNASGDEIRNVKDSAWIFESDGMQSSISHCKYGFLSVNQIHDVYDFTGVGEGTELMYEVGPQVFPGYRNLFSSFLINARECLYCDSCVNGSAYLFGCVGLKRARYCILNKQYTKQEYEILVPKIIEHMQKNVTSAGIPEWGEYFPPALSPFGYNETIASDYFPLTRSEALSRGYNWSDYERPSPEVEKIIPADQLPDTIYEIADNLLNWAIQCEVTGKPFRIIRQELEFYRKYNIPLPRRHPDQRHTDRFALKNPHRLWSRTCDRCAASIQTSYAPGRPESVYCEACYLQSLY